MQPWSLTLGVLVCEMCIYSHLFEHLPRVQRKGVLSQADLLISVGQLGLTTLIAHDVVVLVADDGVLNDAVVARGHHQHLLGAEDNPGMCI